MTERLYYTDPYLREFDARVIRVEPRGAGALLVLDRTAFYPTSGGQPFDVGALHDLRVVDVLDEEEDGSIVHIVEPDPSGHALPEPGQLVHGSIDWVRRFDHMQQHTGQHVLSAAFDRLFGLRTVSFHLGTASATIDLAREASAREIAAAEDEANRIVWEDRGVSIRFVDAEEAARLPLRKEPARTGTLRVIEIESFDLSACGGTHVSRTGAIGVIAVASSERFKGGQRIEFVCGGRALRRFRALRDAVSAAGRLLSVGADDLPATIERLQADAKEQKRASAGLQIELARYQAEDLAASAEEVRLKPDTTNVEVRLKPNVEVRLKPDTTYDRTTYDRTTDDQTTDDQTTDDQTTDDQTADDQTTDDQTTDDQTTDDQTTYDQTTLRLVLRAVEADAAGLKALATSITRKPGYLVALVSTAVPALIVVSRSSDVPVQANAALAALLQTFGGRGGGKADVAQGGGLDGTTAEILAAARAALLS